MDADGLPPDNHVHTEFSWDASTTGSMAASCEQAIALGVPSIAFTEHVDLTPWVVPPEAASFSRQMSRSTSVMTLVCTPPPSTSTPTLTPSTGVVPASQAFES